MVHQYKRSIRGNYRFQVAVFISYIMQVSYWGLIRGRDGEMFIRAGKSLDELTLGSLKFDADKQLILASRGDLAMHILEHLQSTCY